MVLGGDRVDGVAPALLGQRAPGAGRAAHEAAAALERAREPLARRAPRRRRARRPARGRRAPRAARGTTTSRPRCRSRRTAPRAASRTRRTAPAAASRNSWPILPGSSSVPGCSARPCSARQRAQRGARHVRPLRQHLQRADQRVAPEQRMEAPRVTRLHRRRRGVRPPLVGEQLVEPGNAHEPSSTHGALARRQLAARRRRARRRAPGRCRPAPGPRGPRPTPAPSPRFTATAVAGAPPPRPRALRRRQRLVAALAQVRARAPQRDQVAHEVQDRARGRRAGPRRCARRGRRTAATAAHRPG